MSALVESNSTNSSSSVTSINANARIDYILRFSKHLVLVLDELGEGYSDISGQFLTALPDSHNAAYLSLSPKLNDIQVRCRLIEQLFNGVPFDPEQPLLANILGLSTKSKNPISIVIENAHHLSLQIMYELSQLADSAKKTGRDFNVVLTGEVAAGKLVAANPMLFSQKVSMVSAQTGQLISSNSDLFKDPVSRFTLTGYKKFFLVMALLTLVGASVIYSLYQRENFAFSDVGAMINSVKQDLLETDQLVEGKAVNSSAEKDIESKQIESLTPDLSASNNEILTAITHKLSAPTEELSIATPIDVYSALSNDTAQIPTFANEETLTSNEAGMENEPQTELILEDEVYIAPRPMTPAESGTYYTELDFGHVIQYITMTYNSEDQIIGLVDSFSQQHEDFRFKYYLRTINDKKTIVITSEFFVNKEEARIELNTLPTALSTYRPWIKSISAIKQEIAQFKRSQ